MKHILKFIYRNFRKNLVVNLINVGGLTLSMAIVIMLTAYCYSELMTDRHHDNYDQTFLISSNHKDRGIVANTPGVLANHLQTTIPKVQKTIRIMGTWNPSSIGTENGESFRTKLVFADDGFFDVFKYQPVEGNLNKALREPMSAIIISSEAIRLFGKTDVIGQTLIINNEYLVKVTAVIDESQSNSFLAFNIILPISSIPQIPITDSDFTNWNNSFCMTFIQLEKETNHENTEEVIAKMLQDNTNKNNPAVDVSLLPVNEIYYAGIDNSFLDFIIPGNKSKVLILLLVALLIFLMAIINYLNISSYGLTERLHQTGILKIVEASGTQLLRNNLFEATLIFILSFWFAFMLAEILRPGIYYYTGMKFANNLFFSPSFISVSLLVALLCGLLSNLSNAIKIAAFHPIHSIRKRFNLKNNKGLYQGALVIIQFCATISLISFTILVHKQIEFGGNDLGFTKENTLAIKLTGQLKKEVLRDKLSSQANVDEISFSRFYPGKSFSNWGGLMSVNDEEKRVLFSTFDADTNFIHIMGIDLVSGRNFSSRDMLDKNKVIINEAFASEYNIDLPIGKTINIKDEYEIIGVIKDFHFMSKNYAIGPLVLLNRGYATYALVSTHTENFKELSHTAEGIKGICAELSPDSPVEVSFLNDAVENMYQSEIQFRRTFTFFATCAIFISCLGILALSLFTGQQRTKEIGIRKVNGAHVEDILLLLNKDFIKWVAIAFFIATPIAWFSMNLWLESFAYKTEISWWIFIVGGCTALLIALVMVSWQSWSAARKNPVDALRYE